jgi:hypothetical protein
MTGSAPPHETCTVFNELSGLDDAAIHRFVVGEDPTPRVLAGEEAAAQLGDPFATLLLLKGVFPDTAGEVLAALDEATESENPLRKNRFFLLGEGSQIPHTPQTAGLQRNLRFLAARGDGPDGPDILLSAFHPDESDVEVMAWDRARGGFNFYRTVSDTRAWVFAGNSAHALTPPSERKGPFESHLSGAFLMKELRSPWISWDSPAARIQPSVFAQDDPLRQHPWFAERDGNGAITCEEAVARPSMRRWARVRMGAVKEAGTVQRPARILRQVLETPTVNLISSHVESAIADTVDVIEVPQTFFVDSEALVELEDLGLPAPPPFDVPPEIYHQSLERFGFRMSDGNGFERPGDTHFAFLVPERAFEDIVVEAEAIRIGMLTPKLAATLLMVDFPNPVFSSRRAALMRHVPGPGPVENLSERMSDAILAAAQGAPAGSPEDEFAALWSAGEGWQERYALLLQDYYAKVTQRLSTQEGFDAYVRLAESRRERVRAMPITESRLLFAETDIPKAQRSMRADGAVEEA